MGKKWAKSIFRLVPLLGPYLWAVALKSNRPKISPGGMQNEKIENPQTLPEYRSG